MDVGDLDPDPLAEFDRWFTDVADHAVALSTASAGGVPSVRMVLHKGIDDGAFVFYTNRRSRKGAELSENPRAALAFYWPPDRQVRVEGSVQVVDDAVSDAYWATRPRGSQLGAWASHQSEPIADRDVLEAALAEVTSRFEGRPVPRPAYWGGFRIMPARIEFWCHRDDRLHDRVEYRRTDAGTWERRRLSP